MSKLRCAVIGVGYLGKFHAQKYAALPEADLVAVCDTDQESCQKVAQELNTPALTNYQELLGKVDCVSIVVPTHLHYPIAKAFLQAGTHVLIEKPITQTVEQARELIDIAKTKDLTLQVGHLERFNSAQLALDEHLDQPLFIESNRLAPFKPRGTDVNVVLELMIHDIDLIQNMVKSPIVSLDAQGAPVLSPYIDIASARLTFENGCVANVTASRISFKTERKTRIFQRDTYLSVDYQNKSFALFKKGKGEMFPGVPDIVRDESVFENTDALLVEIEAFLACVKSGDQPLVTGEDGASALQTASEITACIKAHLAKQHVSA